MGYVSLFRLPSMQQPNEADRDRGDQASKRSGGFVTKRQFRVLGDLKSDGRQELSNTSASHIYHACPLCSRFDSCFHHLMGPPHVLRELCTHARHQLTVRSSLALRSAGLVSTR